jgi:phosphoribosyl 1,2-cyclic phosphate phosphodiesterase
MNKITLLGTGTSTGVPILGCKCVVCQSKDLRNKRLRSSALLSTHNGKNILIDASPDLRGQLLKNDVTQIDSIIITHDHADHTHGMDDLRPYTFNFNSPLPIYTSNKCILSLKNKFPYIFQTSSYFGNKQILGGGIPKLELNNITGSTTSISHNEFEFLFLPHGHTQTLGLIHSKMAYIVDCQLIPDSDLKILQEKNLELLIIDCLRLTPHDTHLHFDQTLEYIRVINPKLAVLTHLGHEMDHVKITEKILNCTALNVIVGHDNMSLYYS